MRGPDLLIDLFHINLLNPGGKRPFCLDYTLIFDIHIIFQPFRSFIHVIYLQNCIIHLQMDPGDQLYTFDELRCWKVESLRQLLTMRGLTKSGTKEELAALCFSACKLNLPLVPSQDDVLKDNKEMLRQHFE